jgi:hypothetical protein
MNKTIEITEELAQIIDAERGALSRDEYIDNLLKFHKGVTYSHQPESVAETDPEK